MFEHPCPKKYLPNLCSRVVGAIATDCPVLYNFHGQVYAEEISTGLVKKGGGGPDTQQPDTCLELRVIAHD